MYELLGLIYRDGNVIRLSNFGVKLKHAEAEMLDGYGGLIDEFREMAVEILARYQFRNPIDGPKLPLSCDVQPYLCMWKAMRALGDKINYEEMNRVILRIPAMGELDDAIAKISRARAKYGNYKEVSKKTLDEELGTPALTDQPAARIASWFSIAGWGGLIIERHRDSDGYRRLVPASMPFVDRKLKDPPPFFATDSNDEWIKYYAGVALANAKQEAAIRLPRENPIHPLNQIIYGAPGTGKTYSSIEYAMAILENRPVDQEVRTREQRRELMLKFEKSVAAGHVVFTTFHQSYGYEEFVQGIRPDVSARAIRFKKVDGVFKTISDAATRDLNNNYVIIIDEINRGNMSKIFGELITLIEEDKRCGELNQLTAILPMGERFSVPNNLYIIGTMNSADKSISLVDTALRRRFSFVEMAPDESLVTDVTMRNTLHHINAYIREELRSTDLLIGHAYFIDKTADDLGEIMNNNIIPLLYEYFYDDEAKVKKALDCLSGTNFKIDGAARGRIRIAKKE